MKGEVKKLADLRRTSFLGALLNIQPRCVNITEENGEITRGLYTNN